MTMTTPEYEEPHESEESNSPAAPPSNPIARQFAMMILFVLLVTSGISLSATVAGNTTLTLQICGAGLGVIVLIMLAGAVFVGKNRAV